jgi:sec-independent protein translocase protein TatA
MNTFAPHLLALLPNLAGPDMLIIFMIVLIMFGAKKLPELAKGLGQAVREFSKAKDDMHSELNRTTQVLEAPPTYADPNFHPPMTAPQTAVAPAVSQPVAHSVDHASVPNPAGQPVAPAVPVASPAVAASAVPTTPHTPASS